MRLHYVFKAETNCINHFPTVQWVDTITWTLIYCNKIQSSKVAYITYIHKWIDFRLEFISIESLYFKSLSAQISFSPFQNKSATHQGKVLWSAFTLSLKQPHILYQAHCVLSAYHVVGQDGQQQFQFIRLDVDVGLDGVPWPDGPALKHLGTKRDKIKANKMCV